MSMIKELWYGNIGCHETMRNSKEITDKWGIVADLDDKLTATLTEEQRTLYEEFKQALQDVTADESANIYEYGLSIGIGLGYESKKAMGDNNASNEN